jgi:ribosomal protein S18 acetylase RimI-like enzyme
MVEITMLGQEAVTRATPRLVGVYAAAFAEPPHLQGKGDSERFRAVFRSHRPRRGFLLAAARSADGLHGFAYGYLGGSGEWWHDHVAAGIDPAQTERWLRPGHLEVVELAVDPAYQRQGLGEQLLDTLTAESGASRAVLSTRVDAPAIGFYTRRGWRCIGELRFTRSGPLYAILARELRPAA